MNKLFSFVIPAYNEAKYLPSCIEHIRKQRGGFEFEIIVVDNNSTDNTYEVSKNLGMKVFKEMKSGVGQARKTGTDLAQGEYILHVDADTRLPENYLMQVKKRFDKNKNLVCVGGQYYFYDANLFWRMIRPILFPVLFWFVNFKLKRNVGPMGNNMTFKKNIYNKTSGFDEKLKYGEDFDLSAKLCNFGKVELDMTLKCFVSSRRFNLFKKNFWVYIANFFNLCFKGVTYKNELSGHEEDGLTK